MDGYVAGDDDELESALVSWLERQRRRAESDASALLASPNPTLELDPPTANASAQARALDFVRVEGTKFFAGCDEYKIAGWNTYTLIEQAARLPVGSFEANFSLDGRRQVLDMLDAAVDAGFNTVRTWAYSVGKHQSLQIAPGVYHEPLFDGLDWVVYQAGLRGVRLILVFTDYWEYNGGVAQYMDWAGVTAPTKNAFFTDRECKRLYKANARAVIERVNRYTGIAYRDDPAVFAWELINEPRCRNCARHLQDWIEEMAKYVKSLDANHLLSTGQEGFYAAGAKGSVDANPELWALTTGQSFVENHDVPEIDFAVAHLWPDNWGVFSLGGSLGDDFSVDWIRAHERDARELLGKPLVLEEFGATGAGVSAVLETRGGGGGGGGDDDARRAAAARRNARADAVAAYYRRVYAQIERANADGRALAGSMFWTWHHNDLAPLAAGVDEYAVFEDDPVFDEMRRHADALRRTRRPVSEDGCVRRSGANATVVRVERERQANGGRERDVYRGWFLGRVFGRRPACLFGGDRC